MKKILLIGKMNDVVKDINSYLQNFFKIQLCSESVDTTMGMIKVVEPDLIIIALVGIYDTDTTLFTKLQNDFSHIPVLTIGTVKEQERFLKYYTNQTQFQNLIRPIDNETILSTICRKLDLSEEELKGERSNAQSDSRHKILIVDDNTDALRTIRAMLQGRYQIIMANSGLKAITTIGRNRPDLILLDYEMPICDGKQTLEMLRADEETKNIPVIFLTGVNDRDHIEAVLKLHPAGYILKPPVPERLIADIEAILNP